MKKMKALGLVILVLLIWQGGVGCSRHADADKNRKTLIIFCGSTMISPIMELAKLFEATHDVTVKMTSGGSQDLAKSIEVNHVGDVFFPGFKAFVDTMEADGHVVDSGMVGHNELAIFVAKNNPKNLTGNLNQLVDSSLAVVIGHEDLGAVGKESKRILSALNIYEPVVRNTVFMASDSKGLSAAIREGKADIVLNWKAVAQLNDNRDYIDVISIKEAASQPLIMASLVYSANPELAKSFLQLCVSPEGRAVFERFGF
nr:substrate-binding domain-containing protein [uncultured Pseudodesulfovibrio sp.]